MSVSQDDDATIERVARAICLKAGNDPCTLRGDGSANWTYYAPHARAAITAYLSALPERELLAEALEALTRTPLIEALTPTSEEWRNCETVQDTYDLMKHRIRAAADKIRAALTQEPQT